MEEHALPPEPAFAGASFQFGPRLRRAVDLVKQNPLPAWLGGFLFLLVSQNRTDFNLPSSESGSDAVDTMMLFAFIAMGLFGLAMFFA
ncbi:MAG: hypothetical protein KC417_06410, partial [Myxococcales bacterium]|nr:hypothetical protein [Myxococcales bacterium]